MNNNREIIIHKNIIIMNNNREIVHLRMWNNLFVLKDNINEGKNCA